MRAGGKLFFSADRITLWIGANFRVILFALGLFLFAGLAWVGWTEWRAKRESQAYNILYTAQSALQKAGEKANGKGYRASGREHLLAQIMGKGKEKKELVYSEEMRRRAGAFEKSLRGLKNSMAAAAFAIGLADFYRLHEKKEKARQLLSLFAFPKKDSPLYHLASFQLVFYHMEEKDCGKALPFLQSLADNKKAAPFHREAYLQMGLCLEEQNQDERARVFYRKVLAGNKEDSAALLAKEYLRLLKLKPIFADQEAPSKNESGR